MPHHYKIIIYWKGKKENKEDPGSYRPDSLSMIPRKIMEQVIKETERLICNS